MLKIEIIGLEQLTRKFGNAGRILDEELTKAFKDSMLLIGGEVRRRTPVDKGRLRSSIGTEGRDGYIRFKPKRAEMGTNVEYAHWVENRPARHKVGEVGYFKKGVAAAARGIERFFDIAMQKVAERLNK